MKPGSKGYIKFKDYRTYYEIYGKPTATSPLLVLHGGPGAGRYYLLGLAKLAKDRQVIFYDQLGSGLSDHPKDDSLWTIETFVDEVAAVRTQLGLKEIHLLGHSWGGMLAISYLLTRPKGIHGVILGSAMFSMPLYQKEVEKLKAALPQQVYETLKRNEQAGTTESAEYQKAYKKYHQEYIFRGKLYPREYTSPKGLNGDASYRKMWGVSEAFANGSMKSWDMIERLHEITEPVLITSGQYDELTPEQALITHGKLPNSRIKIFTAGSHCAHIEYEAEYLKTVESFLASIDKLDD